MRSPLVIRINLSLRAHLGQDLGNMVEQPHRLLQLCSDHLDHLGHHCRRNSSPADRDCGLDHRQPERLDAVAEGGQVLAFGRRQGGLHADTVRRPRGDQFDESFFVGTKSVLAVPQRVVGVEPDHVERAHSRLVTGARR